MDIEAFRSHFADSPTAAAYVDAVFGPADASLRAEFAETVDESVFPPRQWVSALRVMGEWLDARGLDLALRDRIGYLSCAAESGAPAGRPRPAKNAARRSTMGDAAP